MAKGGGKGGGGGGGESGGTIRGTSGDDTFEIATVDQLRTTGFDGRAGNDTLDLSALSSGVTIKLNNDFRGGSILYPDRSFTGFYSAHSLSDTSSLRLTGTLNGIENLIGTSGDDSLQVSTSASGTRIDGGAGNDMLGVTAPNAIVIGGTGSDSIGSGSTMVGGTYDDGIAVADGESDLFEVSRPTVILDFEVGLDRLILPAMSPADVEGIPTTGWTSITYNGVESALFTYGNSVVTLVGVTAEQASAIEIGLFTLFGGTVAGGPGDDVLWSFNGSDTFLFAAGSGDDVITHFDPSQDVLQFSDSAPTSWLEVDVNGEVALQGVYDDGQSSVTLLGLTAANVDDLILA